MKIINFTTNDKEWGELDTKVRKRTLSKKPIDDNKLLKKVTINDFDVLRIRKSMGGITTDLTKHSIKETDYCVPCENHFVLLRTYKPEDYKYKKCLLYLHGGGFVGGSIESMENQCRIIAEKGKFIVASLEYRLSPETPYPGALKDVINTVEWLIKYQEKIGFCDNNLYLAGDSAGGNLALVAGLLDNKRLIKEIITLYAALDFTPIKKTIYKWKYSDYKMEPKDRRLIHTRLNKFAYLNKLIRLIYIKDNDINDPRICPVYSKDFSNLPPVVMIEAEFDYYLGSNKYFANKLKRSNKRVKELIYKGLDHGFFDRLGQLPQALDVAERIGKIIDN